MAMISRQLLRNRPQELGKIKIGGKGKEITSAEGKKFRAPVKYDHFVVTTRVRGKDENFVKDAAIHRHPDVGERPVELAGVLMYEKPEDNFHSEMCWYRGRTQKIITCDGVTATRLDTGAQGPCAKEHPSKPCQCKPYARLHLQLWASPNALGYHVFRTTSWETTNNIQSALEEIHRSFGTCYRAPVKLVLYPSEDRHQEKDGTTMVSHSYKVGLVLAMSWEQVGAMMLEAKQRMDTTRALLSGEAVAVRTELDQRDAEEAGDIGEEFFPPEDAAERAHAAGVAAMLDGEEEPEPPTVEGDYTVEEDGASEASDDIPGEL